MSSSTVHNRRLIRFARLAVAPIVVCCCLQFAVAPSTAEASILLAELETIDVVKLMAQQDQGNVSTSRASGTSVPTDEPSDNRDETELARLLSAAASPAEGSTSSTSTSSSGGNGGLGNAPFQALSAATMPDLAFTQWTTGEARFALPTPPGNELLRPPQARI